MRVVLPVVPLTDNYLGIFLPVPPAPLAMKNDLITSIIILRCKDEIGQK